MGVKKKKTTPTYINDIIYTFKINKVNKVIDGDTLDCSISLGFNLNLRTKVRLLNVDTPETFRPKTERERKAGIECKKLLKSLVEKYADRLYITTKKKGKYGRWLGEIWYLDENGNLVSINDIINEFIEKNNYYKDILRAPEESDKEDK